MHNLIKALFRALNDYERAQDAYNASPSEATKERVEDTGAFAYVALDDMERSYPHHKHLGHYRSIANQFLYW